MDIVKLSDLMHLMQAHPGPCVTIMLTTHTNGPDGEQDALRLKNLADQAQESLTKGWLRACQAREWLSPIRQCTTDNDFWEKRSLGLAFFLQDGSLTRFRLPIQLPELVLVNHRFYTRPLIHLACDNRRFLVLSVSQHHVTLYEATEFQIDRVNVPGLPQRIDETLNIEGADRGQQRHLANRWGKRKQTSVFHGQGGVKETHKAELTLFFNEIDQALAPVLKNQYAPLVLAGVDYLLPILRKCLSYPYVVNCQIQGNYDYTQESQLLKKAWPAAQAVLLKDQSAAIEKFKNLSKTDLVSADPQTSIKAACDGRIDTLFVNHAEHLWGRCDQYGQVYATHFEPHPDDDDLIDHAAAQTILHHGRVFALDATQMPCNTPIAALLRF